MGNGLNTFWNRPTVVKTNMSKEMLDDAKALFIHTLNICRNEEKRPAYFTDKFNKLYGGGWNCFFANNSSYKFPNDVTLFVHITARQDPPTDSMFLFRTRFSEEEEHKRHEEERKKSEEELKKEFKEECKQRKEEFKRREEEFKQREEELKKQREEEFKRREEELKKQREEEHKKHEEERKRYKEELKQREEEHKKQREEEHKKHEEERKQREEELKKEFKEVRRQREEEFKRREEELKKQREEEHKKHEEERKRYKEELKQREEEHKKQREEEHKRYEEELKQREKQREEERKQHEEELKRREEEHRQLEQQHEEECKRREKLEKEVDKYKSADFEKWTILKYDDSINALLREIGDTYPGEPMEKLRAEARDKFGIDSNKFNLGITGQRGVGKSTLINALRCYGDYGDGAAKINIIECTHEVKGYHHPHPDLQHLILYDLPGAGTDSHPTETYLVDKRLYVFDCLFLVMGVQTSQADLGLAKFAQQKSIPVVFIRNKTMADFNNMQRDPKYENVKEKEIIDDMVSMTKKYIYEELKKVGIISPKLFLIEAHSLRERKNMRFEELDLLNHLSKLQHPRSDLSLKGLKLH